MLSEESMEWLRGLTVRNRFTEGAWLFDMIHGRHGSDEETLDETKIDTASRIIYVCGHTHIPRNQAVRKARIDSPRGAFALGASHNPVQDIYLRQVVGKENKVIGVASKALADPGRGCRM